MAYEPLEPDIEQIDKMFAGCVYDIAIPSPPPIRSYKVTLNIKTIKKGKPTIVDPDWI